MAQDPWAEFRDAPPVQMREGPLVIPAPVDQRQESRDDAAAARSEASLGIQQSGEARAQRSEAFDNTSKLRTEFQKLPAVTNYETVVRQFASALNTQATPTGDQALITAYAKMLDPGSVVREQEFNTVAAGDSAIGSAVARLSKEFGVDDAGLLRPEVRNRVRQEMMNLANQYKLSYETARSDYTDLAKSNGLAVDQVVGRHIGEQYRPEIEKKWAALFPEGSPQTGGGGLKVATGGDFSTDQDIAFANRLQEAWNSGASPDEINAIVQEVTGQTLSPDQMDAMRGSVGGNVTFAPPKSGRREEGGGLGPVGAAAAGSLRGYTANLPEEIASAVGGEIAGEKMQAAMDTAVEQYPVTSGLGELGGAILSPVNRIPGVGRLSPVVRGGVEGAIYGGAYGAGEAPPGADMSQRLEQGAIGALTGGAAGAAAGRLLRRREPIDTSPEVPPAPEIPPVSGAPEVPPPSLTEPAAAGLAQEEMTQLAELAKKAVQPGLGSGAARRELAKMAKVNPEAQAATERLGIDLPPDILSDSAQLKALTGLGRSQIGSTAQAEWANTVQQAAQQADSAIADLGASRDLAETSADVFQRLNGAMESLRRQGDELRTEVNNAISATDRLEAGNLQRELAGRIEELGGIKDAKQAFSQPEKKLLAMLGEGETAQMPTYGRLIQIKDEIGRALEKGDGPWADVNQATLSRYYRALSDDQLAYIETVGGAELAEKMRGSNSAFSKMFDARKDMQALFGRNLESSITPLITRAIEQGSKGDVAAMKSLLSKVPEDMRGPILATGLLSKASGTGYQGGFNFANYAKYYRGLRANGPVYAEFAKALGPSGERVLSDLYAVSRRVAEGNANIVKTGASNQALLALNAERLVTRLFKSGAARTAGTAAGAVTGTLVSPGAGSAAGAGVAHAAMDAMERGGKSNADKLHNLMASPQFKAMIENGSEANMNRLAGAKSFIEWSKGIIPNNFKDRREWIRAAIAPVTAEVTSPPVIEVQ